MAALLLTLSNGAPAHAACQPAWPTAFSFGACTGEPETDKGLLATATPFATLLNQDSAAKFSFGSNQIYDSAPMVYMDSRDSEVTDIESRAVIIGLKWKLDPQ